MTPAQIAKIMSLVDNEWLDKQREAVGTGVHRDLYNRIVRAAVEAALRDAPQQAEGWVMVPADVVKFLTGEGPLDGLWFGEHPFGLGGGKYWWRKHLHAARPSAPTAETFTAKWTEGLTKSAADPQAYRLNSAPTAVEPDERKPLTDEQIEKLRADTFSVNNPFCPVDSKSMRKAVRAAERAHGIAARASKGTPK